MTLFIASLVLTGVAMLAMALGVLLGRGALTGSCGGAGGCELCLRKCRRARATAAEQCRHDRAAEQR